MVAITLICVYVEGPLNEHFSTRDHALSLAAIQAAPIMPMKGLKMNGLTMKGLKQIAHLHVTQIADLHVTVDSNIQFISRSHHVST